MDVILLEKVNKLGKMGEVVTVRAGYARNYLLPQKKALRATDENMAYFQNQRSTLEKVNADKRSVAEKEAKKVEGKTLIIIRQASEAGQLYGSVASRDIADAILADCGVTVERNMVDLNQNFKTLGLFPVVLHLHPEVEVNLTLNIARTREEADIQQKTGKPVVAMDERLERAQARADAQQAKSDAADAADEAAEGSEAEGTAANEEAAA